MSVTLSIACDGSITRPPFNTRSFIVSPYHALQSQPVGHQAQLVAQRTGDLSLLDTVLDVHGVGEKPAIGAIGLQVDTSDKAVAKQKGQYVVAVIALVQRRVDLDAIEEVENPVRAAALPDQRIER